VTGDRNTNLGEKQLRQKNLYNSLRNLFGFIVNSEKKFGAGPKNPLAEALLGEEMLDEAKYFRDKALVNFLNKNVSPSRVVEFENLLNRVEQLRNKLRNLKPTGDKVFDQFLDRFKQNPIMLTDFNKMFNIITVNQQAYQNMANFINDIFKTIYTGKYKQSGLIDKLGGIGKMNEADPNAARTQFERNAQDRKKFKKHLLQFLDDSIALFQYMVKLRKQAAASGKQTKTKQPKQNVSAAPRQKAPSQTSTEPQPDDKGQYSMDLNENHKLMEELNRIKKIMLS
jgi:plasmid maintenance system killer protein